MNCTNEERFMSMSDQIQRELNEWLSCLREAFPGAHIYDVSIAFTIGERSDHPDVVGLERSWNKTTWRVQVDNDNVSNLPIKEAISEIQLRRKIASQVADVSLKLADLLRELPSTGFSREDALTAASLILDEERRGIR